MQIDNIYNNIPQNRTGEIFDTLIEKGGVKIERIVSAGQASPAGFWYDQEKAEWVLVLEGRAVIEFDDGQSVEMQKGGCLYVAPHRKHRVAFTAPDCPTLWIAVHFEIEQN